MRILKNKFEFKELVSQVFTFDYIGALLASVIFPLILVPHFGLLKTSFFFGILNVAVALFLCFKFDKEIEWVKYLKGFGIVSILCLLGGFVFADKIMSFSESLTYADKIIFSKSSSYQRIVLTKSKRDLRLFLNGNLQFSSADEYRYHEALIHPGLEALNNPRHVLVLGGGDGLAVREILKYPSVTSITLVDLDKEMTSLFSKHPMLTKLNMGALKSKKVKVINSDAFQWMKNPHKKFDFIVVDFPDPSNYSIGKLYSTSFYRLLHSALSEEGIAVIQSTSPFVAPKSFWCISHTLESVGFKTFPYHAYIPSFGDWGYLIAVKGTYYKIPQQYKQGLKFIDKETIAQMMSFPKDMKPVNTEINKLNNQILVHYFEDEWAQYVQ